MINASTAFATKIAESSRMFKAKLVHNGADVDCTINKITAYKGACGDELSIGVVYVPYLDVVLTDCSDSLDGEEIDYWIGLVKDWSTQETEYIKMGTYTVVDPKTAGSRMTFRAIGTLGVAGNELYTSTLTFPATIAALISDIEAQMGVTITLKGLTASGTVTKAMTKLRLRDAVGHIAGLLGGFASEDNAGGIVIARYGSGDTATIDPDRSLQVPEFGGSHQVTGIKVTVTPAGTDDQGRDVPEVAYTYGVPNLYDTNEYMTQALFNSMVSNIVGFAYDPAVVNIALGDPRLEAWDMVTVVGLDSATHTVPCLQLTHVFDGGFTTEVYARTLSSEASDMTVIGATGKVIQQISADLYTTSISAATAKADAASAKADAEAAARDAASAASDAASASSSATAAAGSASSAAGSATAAAGSASAAATSASNAEASAQSAASDAADASRDAASAASDAADAARDAASANDSAQSALTGLGIVEEVVDVLNWISEHGQYGLTTDTEVVKGKYYFTRSGSGTSADPYVYSVVVNPTGDPSTQGWYELVSVDEAISNYVSTHLALTSAGLYVTSDQTYGWRVLIKSTGVDILDSQGTVVGSYGATTTVGVATAENVHISSSGVAIRDGSTELATFSPSGVTMKDANGDTTALFTSEQAVIGRSDTQHAVVEPAEFRLEDADGATSFAVSAAPVGEFICSYEPNKYFGTGVTATEALPSKAESGTAISVLIYANRSAESVVLEFVAGTSATKAHTFYDGYVATAAYDGGDAFTFTSTDTAYDTRIELITYAVSHVETQARKVAWPFGDTTDRSYTMWTAPTSGSTITLSGTGYGASSDAFPVASATLAYTFTAGTADAQTQTVTDGGGFTHDFTVTYDGMQEFVLRAAGGGNYIYGAIETVTASFNADYLASMSLGTSVSVGTKKTWSGLDTDIELSGASVNITPHDKNDPYDRASADIGREFITPPEDALYVGGRDVFKPKELWHGGWYMSNTQTVQLSEPISAQPHGILLCWCRYNPSTSTQMDEHWWHVFIPRLKWSIEDLGLYPWSGEEVVVSNPRVLAGYAQINKYLYISDESITGHSGNMSTGTNYANNEAVLACVLGI